MRDLTLALRLLRNAPGFTLPAVLCLALGIGVNASVFSLVNSVYLRPLPVGNADRVVVLSRNGNPLFSYTEYRALADRSRLLTGLAASQPEESDLSFEGDAALIGAEPVSGNYAAVLGARTMMGRWFDREDEPAAVIGYGAWQRLFHGRPDVLGKTIRSESHTYTVVGVAPPEFGGIYAPLRIDLWVPFRYWAAENADRRRVMLFGSLGSGVTPRQASAELNAIATKVRRDFPALANEPAGPLALEPVRGVPNPVSRRQAMPAVILLMTVVSMVLLIASVNVGNLLLARGIGRQREVALRLALGASRARVLRQLMAENLVLGLAGGAAGIGVAYAGNRLLQAALPALPFGEMLRFDLPVDFRVLLYNALVALLTSLLFGLLPAWRGSRYDIAASLRGAGATGGGMRLRVATLIGQIGLSLVLLLTAGLFGRLTLRLHNADPGFATSKRLFAPVFLPQPRFTAAAGRAFYDRTLNRLRLLAGVRSAALTTRLPLTPAGMDTSCVAQGTMKPAPATTMTVGSGYLQTIRIPLLGGRDFNASDQADGLPVAIVNETLARRLWPHQSPVGRGFLFGCDHPRLLNVVGVARDSRIRSLDEADMPHVYRPFSQAYDGGIVFIVVETASETGATAETVRATLASADPDFRTYGVRRLSESLGASYWQVRFEVWVLGILGTLAMALAAIGMYGAMAYHVTARTREIGIRMAVGARPADVFRLVIAQGARVTLAGIAAGLILAAMAARLLAGLLHGVSPADVATWGAAIAVWLIVAPVACWLPARRAIRIEPISALRHD
jgi:putative ABC transport system permease protein